MSDYQIKNVELEITNLCSHRCPYCYIGDVHCKEAVYFSDYHTICRIVDKLNEYGAETIALLGGDPIHHPRILDIMKYIKNNTSISVSLMSNTLDFGGIPVEETSKYIDNIDFTLHGRNAHEHESYCKAREGSYREIMSKLALYISYGVNVNIAINIIPETYNIIYDMAKSVIENGVKFSTLLLQRILPLGRADGDAKYDINKDQIDIAMHQIERVEQDFGIEISFEDPFPMCYVSPKFHKYMKGCPEGINRIPVRGDGSVSSCGAVGDTIVGNILTDSYEKIWLNSARFCMFRDGSYMTNERCINCEYKTQCRGGCPVRYIMSEQGGEHFWKKFENG